MKHYNNFFNKTNTGHQGKKEKENVFNNTLNTFLSIVIWHQTYGLGPLR